MSGHSAGISAQSSLTEKELEQLREAFWEGQVEDLLQEHEGSTQTVLFDVSDGYLGLSICVAPGQGDVFLSISEWKKEPHHELDEWVWVRSKEVSDHV